MGSLLCIFENKIFLSLRHITKNVTEGLKKNFNQKIKLENLSKEFEEEMLFFY